MLDVWDWMHNISNRQFGNDDILCLQDLYKTFIQPLLPYLPNTGSLVVAPHGPLHIMPLCIAQSHDEKYWLDQYLLSFVPNLSVLNVIANRALNDNIQINASQKLLTIAYPGKEGDSNYLRNVIPEAEKIGKTFKPAWQFIHNEDAILKRVLKELRKQMYNFIHFGCHGGFNFKEPERSGLLLADSMLTAFHILLEVNFFHTQLLTLGSCNSGMAHIDRDNVPEGLTQAILIAGADTVVSSLWSVDDESTHALFTRFYQTLKQGNISVSEALHDAMQFVRQDKKWEHPYFWGAFQPVGLTILK